MACPLFSLYCSLISIITITISHIIRFSHTKIRTNTGNSRLLIYINIYKNNIKYGQSESAPSFFLQSGHDHTSASNSSSSAFTFKQSKWCHVSQLSQQTIPSVHSCSQIPHGHLIVFNFFIGRFIIDEDCLLLLPFPFCLLLPSASKWLTVTSSTVHWI